MDRVFASVLLFLLMGTGSGYSTATEEPGEATPPGILVSSGINGGGYWSAASRLQTVAKGMGFDVQVQSSTGSLSNLEQLTARDNPVSLAFAQADALQLYLDNHPGAGEQIEILENIGQECVFIVTAKNSPIQSDRNLREPSEHRLGIASPDSGVAVTFDYMASQLPDLKNTRVVHGETAVALEQLDTSAAGVDAIMVVHRPREHSAEVDMALRQPDRFRFVEILDERLTREGPNGAEVYQSLNLAMPVPGEESPTRVRTICVKGLLLANREKLDIGQRDQLHDLVNQHWGRVYATQ